MQEQLTPLFGDYELIDTGHFEKLERFGRFVTRRPEPQAIWRPSLPSGEWERAGASDALELGYRVFAPYRRQGFALEACRGVLGWYKEHMDCPLYAKIDASNEASINVIELGFSLTDQKYIGSGQWLYLYGWNC